MKKKGLSAARGLLRIFIAAFCMLPLLFSCGSTPPVPESAGIAELLPVAIGGIPQWLLIRGDDTSLPILLFLHGGPGMPAIPFEHAMRELEQHFIVVMWDQRGAGKSYSWSIPRETMTISQFVSDTHEVMQYLLQRFHREKLYLVGHSWGSVIGAIAAKTWPEMLEAYVGVGQIASMAEGERLSYEFTVKRANELGRKDALAELSKITPPYVGAPDELEVQRKWLWLFGGVLYGQTDTRRLVDIALASPEYTILDLLGIDQGAKFTSHAVWDELVRTDLFSRVPRLDVPVYFFLGRHDYNTPSEIAVRYFEGLLAPRGKKLVWFENSAHVIILEEREKFINSLVAVAENGR